MTVDPDGGAAPTGRRRIDWRQAAELVADGKPIDEVVSQVGCSRRHLSRRRHHDPVFRGWIDEAREAAIERQRDRLGALGRAVHKAIEVEVNNNNVRVILWLADRLKLITPPNESAPEHELRELLGGLSQDELREFESLRDAT